MDATETRIDPLPHHATNGVTPMSASILHLLHRAGQVADATFEHHAQGAGLTPRQAVVLAAIAASEEPSQTVLVNATGIDRSTMADVVRRLTKQGLVTRKRTRSDARRYAVRLTPKGYTALDEARDAEAAAEATLLARLPQNLRTGLARSLARLADTAAPSAPRLIAAE